MKKTITLSFLFYSLVAVSMDQIKDTPTVPLSQSEKNSLCFVKAKKCLFPSTPYHISFFTDKLSNEAAPTNEPEHAAREPEVQK